MEGFRKQKLKMNIYKTLDGPHAITELLSKLHFLVLKYIHLYLDIDSNVHKNKEDHIDNRNNCKIKVEPTVYTERGYGLDKIISQLGFL